MLARHCDFLLFLFGARHFCTVFFITQDEVVLFSSRYETGLDGSLARMAQASVWSLLFLELTRLSYNYHEHMHIWCICMYVSLSLISWKPEAAITNNKRVCLRFCTAEVDCAERHEASLGLCATAELLVGVSICICYNLAQATQWLVKVAKIRVKRSQWRAWSWNCREGCLSFQTSGPDILL